MNVFQQFDARKTLLSQNTCYDEDDFTKLRVQTLLAVTRSDDEDAAIREFFLKENWPRDIPVIHTELQNQGSCAALRRAIYDSLGLIRVYTKTPGKTAVYEEPFAIPSGSTIDVLAERVHHDFVERLKFARIWGEEGHDGQQVGRDHVLHEGDMVELHA